MTLGRISQSHPSVCGGGKAFLGHGEWTDKIECCRNTGALKPAQLQQSAKRLRLSQWTVAGYRFRRESYEFCQQYKRCNCISAELHAGWCLSWLLLLSVLSDSITGNNLVWRKISFAPITTSKIRVVVNAAATDGVARIAEVEAWTGSTGNTISNVQWLVIDHLGTPRMIFDQTGNLASVKRHDYLPFGEELSAPTGVRTSALGYSVSDGVRQQFTLKERDIETGLDYFNARYHSSSQGRFTSVDPENAGAEISEPQTWNGYNYARNNPLSFVDPDGLDVEVFWNGSSNGKWYTDSEFERFKRDLRKQGFGVKNGKIYAPVYDDDGNIVGRRAIGTYESDMNSLGQGVSAELARRNDSFQRFGEVGMMYMSFFVLPASEGSLLTGWLGRGLETAPTQVPRALLGIARINLLSAVKNAKLRNFIEYLYREGATVGNGSTADAIRFERETGQLLSKIGHSPKGREAIVGLEPLIRTGKLDPKDAEIARQIVNDLKSALQ
ncbi:MAG TPA: RHS repeat-associated core domain-containing protein [Pyrinomonadaceae bacterium]|nr:RHS repeat-associated core domain-containing protein [Pyrinomonadaceae bacterium]